MIARIAMRDPCATERHAIANAQTAVASISGTVPRLNSGTTGSKSEGSDKMHPRIIMGRNFIHLLFHRKEKQSESKTEHKTESLASHQIEAAKMQ